MKTNVTPIRSIAQELSRVPDEQIACRANKHDWPRLRAGKKLPKNIKLEPDPVAGVCKIIEICGDCGMVRWTVRTPNDLLATTKYIYERPENWVKIARATGITRLDIRGENFRRSLEPVINRLLAAGIEGLRY